MGGRTPDTASARREPRDAAAARDISCDRTIRAHLDADATIAAGQLVPTAPDVDRTSGARLTLECAYAETCWSRARRSARAATVASGRSAARGCADHPAVAIGARHRRVTALLDRPQQDAAPYRYRASYQDRRRGVEVARCDSD